jgi:hypothetical protein
MSGVNYFFALTTTISPAVSSNCRRTVVALRAHHQDELLIPNLMFHPVNPAAGRKILILVQVGINAVVSQPVGERQHLSFMCGRVMGIAEKPFGGAIGCTTHDNAGGGTHPSRARCVRVSHTYPGRFGNESTEDAPMAKKGGQARCRVAFEIGQRLALGPSVRRAVQMSCREIPIAAGTAAGSKGLLSPAMCDVVRTVEICFNFPWAVHVTTTMTYTQRLEYGFLRGPLSALPVAETCFNREQRDWPNRPVGLKVEGKLYRI